MYAGIVDGTHAVAVALLGPADSCGGGHGRACDRPTSGSADPTNPADVIKKFLRVDMFRSPEGPSVRQTRALQHTISVHVECGYVSIRRQKQRQQRIGLSGIIMYIACARRVARVMPVTEALNPAHSATRTYYPVG